MVKSQERSRICGNRGDGRTWVFLEFFQNLGLEYVRDFVPPFTDFFFFFNI